METLNMADVKRINREKGFNFFNADALSFYNSRFPPFATLVGEKAYFLTSDCHPHSAQRLFTIRMCNMTTGEIENIGEFGEYKTHPEAATALQAVVKGAEACLTP